MATAKFTSTEKKSLVNAPNWIYGAFEASEKGNIFARRSEAKALRNYLDDFKSSSPLVNEILAGQKDADEDYEGSLKDAERRLGQVGALLESKASQADADATRGFYMRAAETVAKAVHEGRSQGGEGVSDTEEETMAMIAAALRATPADQARRRAEARAAADRKRDQEKQAAEAQEAARRKKEEEKAAAEAQKEKDARDKARREREAAAREERSRLRREAEARKKLEAEAEAKKVAEEAEAKRKAEADAKVEAEAAERAEMARIKQEKRAAAEAEAKEAAEAEKAAEAEADATRYYVVKKGDTLSGIAKEMYGKAGRWPEIFEANRDIIKKANLIRPGWKLRIPD